MWITTGSSSTSTHYDANDNVLYVCHGKKTVHLWPPGDCHSVQAAPVWMSTPNHGSAPRGTQPAHTVVLQPGEALYLPEGWWHQVDSSEGTVALNLWFRSKGAELTDPSGNFAPTSLAYYTRALMIRSLHEARSACRIEHTRRARSPISL